MNASTLLAIHRLNIRGDQLQCQLAGQLVSVDDAVAEMSERLSSAFNSRSARLIGQLKGDSICRGFAEVDADGFLALSRELVEAVSAVADSAAVCEEALLVFIRWQSDLRDRVLFCWLEPQPQWCLDAELQLQQTKIFGPGSLRFGLQVDFSNQNVFALQPKPAALAEALFECLGFETESNTRTETEQLVGAFESYCQGIDDPQEATEVRQRAYDYCAEHVSQGDNVDLKSLSQQINSNSPDQFFDYLGTLENDFPEEVSLDSRRLRQFVRYSGSMKGISISFSEFLLGEQIVYDEQQQSLLIRDLPPTLKKQLKRHS